jgi:hypothetical protein
MLHSFEKPINRIHSFALNCSPGSSVSEFTLLQYTKLLVSNMKKMTLYADVLQLSSEALVISAMVQIIDQLRIDFRC